MPKRFPTTTAPTHFGPLAPSLLTLRGIRFFSDEHDAGGDGANGGEGGDGGNGGNGGGENSGGANGGDGGSNQQQQQGQGGTPKPAGGREGTFSAKYVSEVRGEAAENRRRAAAEKERADTAERERDELKAWKAETERSSTISKHAQAGGANAAVLNDSSAFRNATKDLDLSKDEDVVAAIKAFVEKNPYAAATPAGPGSSGPGRPGGSTSDRPDTSNSLAGAVGAALSKQGS
jgi:hypothetical protein